MITLEELIIELMPFPQQLKDLCRKDHDFAKALKVAYYDRFIALQAVSITYSPVYPDDEVIGFFVYDYRIKTPKFKQDYIVNKGKRYKDFVLYTGLSKVVNNKNIKHVKEFLSTYGERGKYYKDSHWLTIDELPAKIRFRGLQAVNMATKRIQLGFPTPTQQQIEETYSKLKQLPEGERFTLY